jgi:hypothetical protein
LTQYAGELQIQHTSAFRASLTPLHHDGRERHYGARAILACLA